MRIDRKRKKKESVVKPSIEGFLSRRLQGDKPAMVIEVVKNLEFTVKPGSCYNEKLLRIKMREKSGKVTAHRPYSAKFDLQATCCEACCHEWSKQQLGKQFGSPAETEKT